MEAKPFLLTKLHNALNTLCSGTNFFSRASTITLYSLNTVPLILFLGSNVFLLLLLQHWQQRALSFRILHTFPVLFRVFLIKLFQYKEIGKHAWLLFFFSSQEATVWDAESRQSPDPRKPLYCVYEEDVNIAKQQWPSSTPYKGANTTATATVTSRSSGILVVHYLQVYLNGATVQHSKRNWKNY